MYDEQDEDLDNPGGKKDKSKESKKLEDVMSAVIKMNENSSGNGEEADFTKELRTKFGLNKNNSSKAKKKRKVHLLIAVEPYVHPCLRDFKAQDQRNVIFRYGALGRRAGTTPQQAGQNAL